MKDRIQHQVSWDFVDENKKKKKQEQFLSSKYETCLTLIILRLK